MRRPGDTDPDQPGGRAAQRLREFMRGRVPGWKMPATTEEEARDSVDESSKDDQASDDVHPADRNDG